ncbi:MAG: hypothetical protein H7293_21295, partial [Candidatus Saccharibacteria bacterium]|nr:hypothetical protein [Rhodoferax sp.]
CLSDRILVHARDGAASMKVLAFAKAAGHESIGAFYFGLIHLGVYCLF